MSMMEKKTILITGGAGSLGRALVRKILSEYNDVGKIIVFSRDELKHHYMNWEFSDDGEKIEYVIGDIRDPERISQTCKGVDLIIHAAALKQIYSCENNPEECYKTNVVGTQNVIKAAKSNEVRKLLFISTDKAVDPTSVYGNSKQACERLITKAHDQQIQCATVRLGNLLGSAGSVIPFFMKIRHTGELPVTDPDMTRFGGTLAQGAEACFYALRYMKGGEIFIPRWKSFKVGDLASAIAPECRQKIIGTRKHEKMHESFFASVEMSKLLENRDYYIITKEVIREDEAIDSYQSITCQLKDVFSSLENEQCNLREILQDMINRKLYAF